MKRLIGLLLAFCLVMTLAGAWASAETLVYASSFAAGDDDWFARGASRVYHTTEATLRTEGRSDNWNSPGRYFELVPDNEYTLSVEVYQDGADSANFMISLEKVADGITGWENLVRGTVKKGEWTTLSGTYTFADYESYVLYVETSDAPTLDFEIRNFRVESPNGIPEPKVTEAPTVVPEAADVPSLKDAYAPYFDFGAAVPQSAFTGRDNIQLMELMKNQFSILTPENELKPDSVLDVSASRQLAKEDETAVAIRLSAAKQLLRFAQQNGIKVHGHVLIWHSQTPEAFFHEGYDTQKPLVSREVMLGRMENYIREVLTQTEELYPGVIVSWDVVNEAIDDGTNWIRQGSNWTRTIGEDFVEKAFEFARKYAADGLLLYYNDYNTAYAGKLNGIIKLIRPLIEQGTIDGYGFQMHHTTGQPSNQMITTAVEKIAALGIRLRVSEMDIGITKYTETSLQAQKDKYKAMMELMLRFADQTEAVQVWGITDTMSWRSSSYPLLFDRNRNPKPAFYGVLEAADEWAGKSE